jgi:hypothetical protein
MKSKKTIIDKTVYGGTLTDKYYFIFDDGTDMQVPFYEWDQLKAGDTYYIEDVVPDSFVESMKDIVKGRTVPLDKALNEEPSFNWKDAHDLQQKLVISYTLENEKLKDRIKELEAPSESVEKICDQIQDIYDKKEYYRMHNHILLTANDELTRANKMMKETLINICECFEMRDELYTEDWHALQAFANKALICLECIGYDKKDNKS